MERRRLVMVAATSYKKYCGATLPWLFRKLDLSDLITRKVVIVDPPIYWGI